MQSVRTQRARYRDSRPHAYRKGLAPLELVLSLPILLFVMGLMIVIGWTATFKVRAQIHAREAASRSILASYPLSNAQYMPTPPGFPPPAEMSVDRTYVPCIPMPTAELALYDSHPVTRGPVLVEPETGQSLRVDRDILDVRRGMISGRAVVDRGFPVMGEMPPKRFRHDVRFPVLDNRWQFWQKGLGSNSSRRSLKLYPSLAGDWQSVTAGYSAQFRRLEGMLSSGLRRREMDLFDRVFRDYYPNPPRNARTSDRGQLSGFADRMIERIYGRPRPRRSLAEAGIPGALTQDFLNHYLQLARQARRNMQSDAAYIPLIQQLESFRSDLLQ